MDIKTDIESGLVLGIAESEAELEKSYKKDIQVCLKNYNHVVCTIKVKLSSVQREQTSKGGRLVPLGCSN